MTHKKLPRSSGWITVPGEWDGLTLAPSTKGNGHLRTWVRQGRLNNSPRGWLSRGCTRPRLLVGGTIVEGDQLVESRGRRVAADRNAEDRAPRVKRRAVAKGCAGGLGCWGRRRLKQRLGGGTWSVIGRENIDREKNTIT